MSLIGFLKRNKHNILFFLIVLSVLFFLNSKFKMIEGLKLTSQQSAALGAGNKPKIVRSAWGNVKI